MDNKEFIIVNTISEDIRLVEVIDKKTLKSKMALQCKCGNIDENLFRYRKKHELLKTEKGSKYKYYDIESVFCIKGRCTNYIYKLQLDRQYAEINATIANIKELNPQPTNEQPTKS